jgi:hypothetical protein
MRSWVPSNHVVVPDLLRYSSKFDNQKPGVASNANTDALHSDGHLIVILWRRLTLICSV